MGFVEKRKLLLAEAIHAGRIPRYLYKYRRDSQWTTEIFEKSAMYFSVPTEFNDPFDCNLSEVTNHTQDDADRFLAHVMHGMPDGETLRAEGTTISKAVEIMSAAKAEALSKMGVLCLSQRFDSMLMWSHYTNDHKGLVIEFDLLADLEFFSTPVRAVYTDGYEPTNYFQDPHATVERIISTKATCWSYEEEIRIVKSGVTGPIEFSPSAIRRIIFGCRSTPAFIASVRVCARLAPSSMWGSPSFSQPMQSLSWRWRATLHSQTMTPEPDRSP